LICEFKTLETNQKVETILLRSDGFILSNYYLVVLNTIF